MSTPLTEATPLFDVPRLDDITIDGNADDWGDRGFRVGVLGDGTGKVKPAADLDVAFRLGWDERGLLLLVSVRDDVFDEADGALWSKDSLEIFYSPHRGSPDVFQVVISPGMDPRHPELRWSTHDYRVTEALKQTPGTVTAKRTRTANGYILEVLLPWENFAIKPQAGRELAFQIYVNDADGGFRSQVRWHPIAGAHDSMNMHRLQLSDKPSPPVNALARGEYERLRRVRVEVAATTDLLDKIVAVKEGERELGSVPLTSQDGRAGAKLVLPMPPRDKPYGPLTVTVDGRLLKTISLPDPQEARAKAFMAQELSFDRSVFSGPGFPPGDFAQPSYVEELIGPYVLTTTFYDADYNRVTLAEKPGRYGAVVEIKTEDGKAFRRLRTLFRMPQMFPWWLRDFAGTVEFPPETGIHPGVTAGQKSSAGRYLKDLVIKSFSSDSWTAALMSALYETKPGAADASVFDDFKARDRQWWVGLKRKLDGADQLYPGPFVCPQAVTGKPAPVLHEGTLQAAGMKPGAVEKIDAVLKEWSADSDEAFAICVARHGVVVLHQAYGLRDGKPMTVTTRSWMASLTKIFSGAAIMMLVDQGLVSLDDPVAKFLPAFRGVSVATPLTIRHLFNHTGGFQGHWGDALNDFEDLMAGYYPYLAVGQRYEYSGTDLALGSKIIETITGEALPQFYKRHLLDPLGCSDTTVTDSSGDAAGTPMDMAKIGQMLLNRGRYGDKLFMRAETFPQMLPRRLTKELGPDTTTEWGIGTTWYKGEGLGRGTFGHGAASAALLRIDPENDLVITMTRNSWDKNLEKYQPKFLAAIVENLAE